MKLKIISWNINGLRSLMKKDILYDLIENKNPNIICFSETKLTTTIDVEQTLKDKIKGYKYRYWNSSIERKGYSGVAVFSKKKPIDVTYGIKSKEHDQEGRVITLEYDNFYLINVYVPNAGQELKRLSYRVNSWDVEFKSYLKKLSKKKNIIVCGDLNVAHQEIDIHNPKTNLKSSGFTIEERNSFSKLLKDVNLIDTFRYLNPNEVKYSFWTYLRNARAKNIGWRIDYFLVSDKMSNNVKKSDILTTVEGSDHAPIVLQLEI